MSAPSLLNALNDDTLTHVFSLLDRQSTQSIALVATHAYHLIGPQRVHDSYVCSTSSPSLLSKHFKHFMMTHPHTNVPQSQHRSSLVISPKHALKPVDLQNVSKLLFEAVNLRTLVLHHFEMAIALEPSIGAAVSALLHLQDIELVGIRQGALRLLPSFASAQSLRRIHIAGARLS